MGSVAEIFREAEAKAAEHLEKHPDCPLFAEDAWALTDEIRADLLSVVDSARKEGLIDFEDEFDLEHAIGTWGDPENFGWPDTTEAWKKFATAQVCMELVMTLEEAQHGSPTIPDLLSALTRMRHDEGVGVGVIAVPGGALPDELSDALRKMAQEQTQESKQTKPEEKDEDVDWIRRGYL